MCPSLSQTPAVEVLVATEFIRDCIINPDKNRMIHDSIAQGTSQYEMQTFDQSLYDLYSRGLITMEEAMERASNPDEFKLRTSGIASTSDMSRMEMEQTVTKDTKELQLQHFGRGKK